MGGVIPGQDATDPAERQPRAGSGDATLQEVGVQFGGEAGVPGAEGARRLKEPVKPATGYVAF